MRRIRSLRGLAQATQHKQVIVYGSRNRRMPARLAMWLPGFLILRFLNAGLTLYEKPERR